MYWSLWFHHNVMLIGQKDHLHIGFFFVCFFIGLYTKVYSTAFWLKLRRGWFFLEHILKQQKHNKKKIRTQNDEDIHSCFVSKLAMLYANYYFMNAVPVSDRSIYRASGNLPNCPYKVNGVKILDHFDFFIVWTKTVFHLFLKYCLLCSTE